MIAIIYVKKICKLSFSKRFILFYVEFKGRNAKISTTKQNVPSADTLSALSLRVLEENWSNFEIDRMCVNVSIRSKWLQVNSDPWTSQTTKLTPSQLRPPNSHPPNSDPSRFRLPQIRPSQFRPLPIQTVPTQTPGQFRTLGNSDPPNSHLLQFRPLPIQTLPTQTLDNSEPSNSDPPHSDTPPPPLRPPTIHTPSIQTLPNSDHPSQIPFRFRHFQSRPPKSDPPNSDPLSIQSLLVRNFLGMCMPLKIRNTVVHGI